MRARKETVKFIVLTEKDRKLLMSIDKSLKDIRSGRVKELIASKINHKHK